MIKLNELDSLRFKEDFASELKKIKKEISLIDPYDNFRVLQLKDYIDFLLVSYDAKLIKDYARMLITVSTILGHICEGNISYSVYYVDVLEKMLELMKLTVTNKSYITKYYIDLVKGILNDLVLIMDSIDVSLKIDYERIKCFFFLTEHIADSLYIYELSYLANANVLLINRIIEGDMVDDEYLIEKSVKLTYANVINLRDNISLNNIGLNRN